MRFLFNDTTCYLADPREDRVLHRRQRQHWDTVHQHIRETNGGHSPVVAVGAGEAITTSRYLDINSESWQRSRFGGLPHPDELVSDAEKFVSQLDVWHLTALSAIATETKSLLIAIAALQEFAGMQDLKNIVNAGRVEEEFQIENWGLVEGGHDYDRLNSSISVGSARIMLDMLKHK